MYSFSETIEKLRLEQRFSERGFAKKIGLSATGYKSAVKIDDWKVSVLEKCCDVLNYNFIELLSECEKTPHKLYKKEIEINSSIAAEPKVEYKLNPSIKEQKLILEATIKELRGQVEYFRNLYEINLNK